MADIADQEPVPPTLEAIPARLDQTQEQLTELFGVSSATVNRWEDGAPMPQKAADGHPALAAEEFSDSTR